MKTFLDKYGTTDMGQLDVVKVIQDMMAIMKKNKISMPPGLSLLVRGLTHMEGVLAEISPEINIVQIAAGRIHSEFFQKKNIKKVLHNDGKRLYQSLHKAIDIPGLLADLLRDYTKGESRIHLDLHI